MKNRKAPGGTINNVSNKGDEIVDGLREFLEVLRSGEPLESRFTVRTCKIAPPPEYDGEGVRRVRDLLAMSQAAFAAFLGADASTVQSWEQGLRPPSPLARRLLSEIEADPAHWRKRLAACLTGPAGAGGSPTASGPRPRSSRRTGSIGRTA
ncbi:MAG: helix-turn-helix domain-containing protein [Isosphaeraceae bacterium]